MDTIAVPPHDASSKDIASETQAFACQERRLELSREQLERVAIAEHEKRGGRVDRSRMESSVLSKGCDWQVLITILPRAPGAHFGVLIDGRSGRAKDYFPGS